MLATEKSYDDHDKSKQRLYFESQHFPAYFRLLKWKFLDICVESMSWNNIGHFQLFESFFPQGKLIETVKKITDDPPSLADDPYMKQIRARNLDEKCRKQAETYVKLRNEHLIKVQRRRHAEYFLNKVLFNEEGLRIADRLMFENCFQVYGTTHWQDLPENWITVELFKNNFYDENELKDNPYGMQKLDRVANSARGMIIMRYLKSNSYCKTEFKILIDEVHDKQNQISTDLVRGLLDEGPEFELKMVDGVEQKFKAEKWNVHKTLIMFLSIPGFNSNTRKENERDEWYYGLLDAMKNDPANRAALYFLDKEYAEKLEEREEEKDRLRMQILKGQRTDEEAVGNQVFKEIRPQPTDSGYNPDAEVAELVLRTYQEELVQPALEGKNCVIVAPTGSGKTEVAIYAALNHIKERNSIGKPARVVLLVPKIPLVSQQKDRFLKYCNGRYHVNGFHGSEKSDSGEGRRDDVLLAHIVVMTPQILINMLQSVRQNERLYVSDFSMMIFDEVHKTTGNHPYVGINRLVQEWQYEKPQIIGLTASLNVSATAQTEESRMLDGIYEMLALLNAPNLSTIKHQASIDELNTYVRKPDDSVEVCQPGENELRSYIERYLVSSHVKLCTELERLSKLRHNCFRPNVFKKFKLENTRKYEKYESLLQGIIQDLNKLNTTEKENAQALAKYIKVYVEARGIVDVMPAIVAFNYMERAIKELDQSGKQFCDFSRNIDSLRQTSEGIEPSIVKKLKDTLINQFQVSPDSRVIIFVTQRSTAQRVSDFLNDSQVMQQFGKRDEDMVGFVLGTNKQGAVQQNQQEQQIVLDKFNNGKLKVIVATSVVEEGLDVAACNLIIKYNCPSKSAIQLLQQRGRARAKNSRSVLFSVKSRVNEDENNALISEKFMRMCVKKIEQNGQKQLASEVKRAAGVIEKARKRELEEQLSLRARHENKIYKLACSQCQSHFCKSDDMRKVFSNYMSFDPSIWKYLKVLSKKKTSEYLSEETQALSTLECENCNSNVGKAYKMRGVYLPQLDVTAINFIPEHGDDGSSTKRKWTAVESDLFYVPEANQNDFEIMLNALSDTEANMEKKRHMDLDSKQHIRDIEKNKNRMLKETMERERFLERERPIRLGTDYSEDEDED